jgi:choline dehydrogenase-like flavoprotein
LRHLRPGAKPVSLKLRAPALAFITRDGDRLAPLRSTTFDGLVSLAKGGFANVWGAGVYRFNEDDAPGFPFRPGELATHYDAVARHIGISGAEDDMAAEFGHEPDLQPPLRLGPNAAAILEAYRAKRPPGVRLGHARLAVLTRPHNGRPPYQYAGTEFIAPAEPAAYNPAATIDQLAAEGHIVYAPGWLVQRYQETESGVAVEAISETGELRVFRSRQLLLAAGTLNTARIVLASHHDYESRLPLLDNPMTILAGVHPGRIGYRQPPQESGYAQLNFVLEASHYGDKFQGSVYTPAHAPMTEFLAKLPFPMDAGRRMLRCLKPALSLAMVFHPAEPTANRYLRLLPDGALHAEYEWRPDERLPRQLVDLFRSLGCLTHAALVQHAGPGQGIHYAGALPLSANPKRYQLHADGRLEGTRGVYVCDGSCFPRLPAKNLTYTIMANAHRIASGLGAA